MVDKTLLVIIFVTLFIATTIGIFVVFGVINAWRKRKVKRVAAKLGLEFQPNLNLKRELKHFRSLTFNQFSIIRNCLSGDADGIAFKVFDFHDTNHGDRHETMTLIQLEQTQLPAFYIRPESRKRAGAVVLQRNSNSFDLDDQAFSSNHLLVSPQPEQTRDLLTDGVTHLIRKNRWTVECDGTQVLIFSANRKVDSDHLKPFLSDSLKLVMQIRTAELTELAVG